MRQSITKLLGAASLSFGFVAFLAPSIGTAQITEIIDATGDGGNALDGAGFLVLDGAGNVYVTGVESSNAFKITTGGTITEIIDPSGAGPGAVLSCSNGAAIDASGNVFVAGDDSDNAFKIADPCGAGTITEIIDDTGDGSNAFSGTIGVATDAAGNVYVVGDNTNNVFQITPGGSITEIIDATGDGANPLDTPLWVAVDASGRVFVTAADSNNVFMITDPAGANTITEVLDAVGDGMGNALAEPEGIAVDGAGNVYVVGLGSDNVFMIEDPGGANTVTEILDGSGGGVATFDDPIGVATDGAGSVYVTGFSSNNAFRIDDPGGANTVSLVIDAAGDCAGNALDGPAGIAIDAAGNVFVAGFASDNVFKVATKLGGNYCVGAANSVGDGARISATGSAVAADQDLTLTVGCAPDDVPGLFYFGPTQVQSPFGEGFRCVAGMAGTIKRMYPFAVTGPMNGNPVGTAIRAADFAAGYGSALVAGADLNFQYWYRDVMGGPSGYNLSDAVNVVFQ